MMFIMVEKRDPAEAGATDKPYVLRHGRRDTNLDRDNVRLLATSAAKQLMDFDREASEILIQVSAVALALTKRGVDNDWAHEIARAHVGSSKPDGHGSAALQPDALKVLMMRIKNPGAGMPASEHGRLPPEDAAEDLSYAMAEAHIFAYHAIEGFDR